MSDNFPLTPGSGRNAATDQVTYSGDTADVQLIKLVDTAGSEGSKTVVGHGLATEAKQDTQTTALQLLDDIIKADDAGFTAGSDDRRLQRGSIPCR